MTDLSSQAPGTPGAPRPSLAALDVPCRRRPASARGAGASASSTTRRTGTATPSTCSAAPSSGSSAPPPTPASGASTPSGGSPSFPDEQVVGAYRAGAPPGGFRRLPPLRLPHARAGGAECPLARPRAGFRARTSGTTAGDKFIPVSKQMLHSNFLASAGHLRPRRALRRFSPQAHLGEVPVPGRVQRPGHQRARHPHGRSLGARDAAHPLAQSRRSTRRGERSP